MSKRPKMVRAVRRLRLCHVSGKWSGRAKRFALKIRALALTHDVITTTESKGMLDAVKRALPNGWEACILGEFIVACRKAKARLGAGRLSVISDEFTGSEDWRDTRVHWRWLRVPGQRAILLAVSHFSSAVQAGAGWSGFDKGVDSWQTAARAIAAAARRRTRLAVGAVFVFCADLNVHLGMREWRDRARSALGMQGVWDQTRPKRGTHGPVRVIDAIYATCAIRWGRVLPSLGGVFDHKPIRGTLILPKPSERRARYEHAA